ncbi:hypothetical protein DSO57_1034135 [Entomophthora muscae]|uniref:Uncharacterized protein n=1 Tax=Entomophthora muscae TaxID=34485 RepID=A0ACC2SZU8_9FUNG|nr:hypothetical protein DSO57_1034135 [Entomophthora muscae]
MFLTQTLNRSHCLKCCLPPTDKANSELKDIWAVIQLLKVITRQQAAQEAQASPPPTPDPNIVILTNQVANMQAEFEEMCATNLAVNSSPLHSKEGGCFPGLKGCP